MKYIGFVPLDCICEISHCVRYAHCIVLKRDLRRIALLVLISSRNMHITELQYITDRLPVPFPGGNGRGSQTPQTSLLPRSCANWQAVETPRRQSI